MLFRLEWNLNTITPAVMLNYIMLNSTSLFGDSFNSLYEEVVHSLLQIFTSWFFDT